jgi:hypothetical protein
MGDIRVLTLNRDRGNEMERFKYSAPLMIAVALAFILAGCAKTPNAEKCAAHAAMNTAMSIGADRYATTSFRTATAFWATAESQMTDKKYEKARQAYIAAKSAFEKAIVIAETGKKAMTNAVTAALPSIENDWKILETTARKAGKKMKDKKADWAADDKAFTEGLQAAKDMVATNPLGARAKIAGLMLIIDKWDALLNTLTTASAKADVLKMKKDQQKSVRSHFSIA